MDVSYVCVRAAGPKRIPKRARQHTEMTCRQLKMPYRTHNTSPPITTPTPPICLLCPNIPPIPTPRQQRRPFTNHLYLFARSPPTSLALLTSTSISAACCRCLRWRPREAPLRVPAAVQEGRAFPAPPPPHLVAEAAAPPCFQSASLIKARRMCYMCVRAAGPKGIP